MATVKVRGKGGKTIKVKIKASTAKALARQINENQSAATTATGT